MIRPHLNFHHASWWVAVYHKFINWLDCALLSRCQWSASASTSRKYSTQFEITHIFNQWTITQTENSQIPKWKLFLSVFEIFRSFYTTQQPLLCLPSIASANHYVHPNLSGPNTQITSNKGNHGSILQTIGVFEHVMYRVALTRAWQCYHRTRLQRAWCWSAKWNWKKFRCFVEIVRTNQRMLQVDSCRGWPGSMIQIGYRTVNLALNQSSWVLTSQVGSWPVKLALDQSSLFDLIFIALYLYAISTDFSSQSKLQFKWQIKRSNSSFCDTLKDHRILVRDLGF